MNARIEVIDLAAMVDELAAIKSLLANHAAMVEAQQERHDAIVKHLKATGRDRIDGTKHTAVISLSEREGINTENYKALKLSHPAIAAQYATRTIIETLKLTGRKVH